MSVWANHALQTVQTRQVSRVASIAGKLQESRGDDSPTGSDAVRPECASRARGDA